MYKTYAVGARDLTKTAENMVHLLEMDTRIVKQPDITRNGPHHPRGTA